MNHQSPIITTTTTITIIIIIHHHHESSSSSSSPSSFIIKLPLRSQSLTRANVMTGRTPCITPAAKLWLRRRKRLLVADERLALQGLNMVKFEEALGTCTENFKAKLAGNAFSFHCFTIGFLAALCSLPVTWLG